MQFITNSIISQIRCFFSFLGGAVTLTNESTTDNTHYYRPFAILKDDFYLPSRRTGNNFFRPMMINNFTSFLPFSFARTSPPHTISGGMRIMANGEAIN